MKIGVVIPLFKVVRHIRNVIDSLPEFIDYIIVVDDKCPEFSGREVEKINDKRLIILRHQINLGVGAAMITGYKKALELGCDIIVKIDGDGQMDPAQIKRIIAPLQSGQADYTKGNRFMHVKTLRLMPKIRLVGNSILSFLVKLASGYWNVLDPTNGYTAISADTLRELDLSNIAKRYFFESDMLINLNIINAVVKDIDIPARYGDEKSSLSVCKAMIQFPPQLFKGFLKRLFLKYFIYDFNMASVYVLIGVPMFIFGIVFGFTQWRESIIFGTPRPLGTIMLIALSITISFQMLLQAINIDINLIPKKKYK
jgi:dolichol-phosphate mannosyltransferase